MDLPGFPSFPPGDPEHRSAVVLPDAAPRISGNASPALANAHTMSGNTIQTFSFLHPLKQNTTKDNYDRKVNSILKPFNR